MDFRGRLTISAYGDVRKVAPDVVRAISSSGIVFHHVPADVKDASDKKILIDMLLWAIDNPAPTNVLLISSDRDFSGALHQLRLRKYIILLAQPKALSSSLAATANHIWNWTNLVSGEHALLLKDNSAESGYPVLRSRANLLNTDLRLENECKTPFPGYQPRRSSNEGKETQGVCLDLTVEISGQRHLRCPPDTKKKIEVRDNRCNRVTQTRNIVKKKMGKECQNILKQKTGGRLNNNNSTKTARSSKQQIVN